MKQINFVGGILSLIMAGILCQFSVGNVGALSMVGMFFFFDIIY